MNDLPDGIIADEPFIKISKRAIRRHHYQRLKKRQEYQHYWKYILLGMDNSMPFPETYFCIRINTPVLCSGPCCGNPRRHFGELTIQEKKANETQLDQLPFDTQGGE